MRHTGHIPQRSLIHWYSLGTDSAAGNRIATAPGSPKSGLGVLP
jgi:hypothetical protein